MPLGRGGKDSSLGCARDLQAGTPRTLGIFDCQYWGGWAVPWHLGVETGVLLDSVRCTGRAPVPQMHPGPKVRVVAVNPCDKGHRPRTPAIAWFSSFGQR